MSSQITFYTSTRTFVQTFRVNMVAAIDWCSHTTHDWIWLVSCLGFNGPLRQYFSLYRAISQRVRKKREKIDERKISKQPPPAPTASAIDPCPTIIQISRTLRLWIFAKHYRTTRPPPHDWTSVTLFLCEIISSLDSLWCPGDSIKLLFDIFDINLKNKLKRKVKERKVKRKKERSVVNRRDRWIIVWTSMQGDDRIASTLKRCCSNARVILKLVNIL